MEKFELKVDVNTPYIKAIRFLGSTGLGFFIAAIVFTFKFEGEIDWVNSSTGILISLFFSLFPGALKKQCLIIDEVGIHLHNYTFHWGQKKEMAWEKIQGIGVQKNIIEIKNSIGSKEKIDLPLHTESQLEDLKSYLKQMAEIRNLEYIT